MSMAFSAIISVLFSGINTLINIVKYGRALVGRSHGLEFQLGER
jgi:hypothetical protein